MISVVIPTWNEAAQLPRTLASIQGQAGECEILVVDARSTDGTEMIARSAGALVIPAERRQRATQMNTGVAAASGDILLFLHADTRLPSGAFGAIERTLRNAKVIGGGFARRYDSPSMLLRLT